MPDLTGSAAGQRAAPYPSAGGFLVVFLATACWATSAIFISLLGSDTAFSALALAFWRDLATFIALLAGVGILRPAQLRVTRSDLGSLAAMGFCLGVFHIFWNLGVFLNGAAVAAVQQAAMPAIVAVAAWLLWKESLNGIKVLAIILTMTGTVLVSSPNITRQTGLSLGDILIGLGIPIMYASWILLGKRARATLAPFAILTYVFGFAALILLPFQFFTPQPWPLPSSGWLWFTGLVGLSTITGFALYTLALGILPASVASILAMTEIVFVGVYAYLLFDESLTGVLVLGAALVVGGVLLLTVRGLRIAEN